MTEEQRQKLKEIEVIQSELCKMKETNANNNKGLCSIANILEKDNTPKEEFFFRRECKEPVKLIDNLNKPFENTKNTLIHNSITDPGLNYTSNYNLVDPITMQYINYNNPYINTNFGFNNLNPMFNSNVLNYDANLVNPYMMQSQILLTNNVNDNKENDRVLTFAEKIQENYFNKDKEKTNDVEKEFDKIVDTGNYYF